MNNVNMESLWADDNEKIIQEIQKANNNFFEYMKLENNKSKKDFHSVVVGIKEVCKFWCGKTYLGEKKSKDIENAFQCFFKNFMDFLMDCKISKHSYKRKFAATVLYQGKIYRYLGYGISSNRKKKAIEPNYDGVYVSWSKEPQNSYIESKLYGEMTWIEAEIKSPYFGIDLETMESSVGNEKEVVFPTLKDCVTNIKYIR